MGHDNGPDHPYSFVRSRDGRVGYVSGVLPYAEDGSIEHAPERAVDRALDILAERLADAGFDLDDVVKTTVFVTDLAWRDALNAAYLRRFSLPMPARTAVQVSALPRGAPLELDAVVQAAERA